MVQQEISLLKEKQLDLVFHRSPSIHDKDPDLVFVPIWQESFLVVLPAAHPLTKQEQISLPMLKNEAIVLPSLEALPVLQREGVVYRPLLDKILSCQMTIAYRKADSSIVLQNFLDATQDVIKLFQNTLNHAS